MHLSRDASSIDPDDGNCRNIDRTLHTTTRDALECLLRSLETERYGCTPVGRLLNEAYR